MSILNGSDLPKPEKWKRGSLKGLALPGYDHLNPLELPWAEARARKPVPEGFRVAKASGSRLVIRQVVRDEILYFKRSRPKRLQRRLSEKLQGSKTRREFSAARDFLRAGIRVPVPVLWAKDEESGATFLVTRSFPETWIDLRTYFKSYGLTDTMVRELAGFARTLHDTPAYHGDFRADHIYLQDAPEESPPFERFAMIDLDGAHVGAVVSKRDRRKAVRQLFASLHRCHLTREKAILFGEVYEGDQPAGLKAEKLFEKTLHTFTGKAIVED